MTDNLALTIAPEEKDLVDQSIPYQVFLIFFLRPSNNLFDVLCLVYRDLQENVSKEVVAEGDIADRMEKGENDDRTSSASSSDDTDSGLEANVEDPWAIVELVDDSEKWKGKVYWISVHTSKNPT